MIRRVRFVHQGQGRTPGGSSAPKHDDMRETKGKQDKSVASCAATPDDTSPQCGPGKRKTRAFNGIPSSFQGFCAIGRVTSNMGDGSRFDVLLPSMLTATTNSAVSTVGSGEISDFHENRESSGIKIAQRKRKSANSTCVPCISACEPLCTVLRRIAYGIPLQ